jgi:hypothetical protein
VASPTRDSFAKRWNAPSPRSSQRVLCTTNKYTAVKVALRPFCFSLIHKLNPEFSQRPGGFRNQVNQQGKLPVELSGFVDKQTNLRTCAKIKLRLARSFPISRRVHWNEIRLPNQTTVRENRNPELHLEVPSGTQSYSANQIFS